MCCRIQQRGAQAGELKIIAKIIGKFEIIGKIIVSMGIKYY
jgi:hypothetical protein